jgi:hypothetical protein
MQAASQSRSQTDEKESEGGQGRSPSKKAHVNLVSMSLDEPSQAPKDTTNIQRGYSVFIP